jgi:hypothetical protein
MCTVDLPLRYQADERQHRARSIGGHRPSTRYSSFVSASRAERARAPKGSSRRSSGTIACLANRLRGSCVSDSRDVAKKLSDRRALRTQEQSPARHAVAMGFPGRQAAVVLRGLLLPGQGAARRQCCC